MGLADRVEAWARRFQRSGGGRPGPKPRRPGVRAAREQAARGQQGKDARGSRRFTRRSLQKR